MNLNFFLKHLTFFTSKVRQIDTAISYKKLDTFRYIEVRYYYIITIGSTMNIYFEYFQTFESLILFDIDRSHIET